MDRFLEMAAAALGKIFEKTHICHLVFRDLKDQDVNDLDISSEVLSRIKNKFLRTAVEQRQMLRTRRPERGSSSHGESDELDFDKLLKGEREADNYCENELNP